jgi:hypothetical protein
MSAWPLEIADAEAIARGICTPHHVKKNGTLKPGAYWPPNDTDEVSVMRACWIGSNGCKRHSKTLERPLETPPKIYRGLAILSAKQIREAGAQIIDTRHIFEGHADIKHGIVPSKGEPPPPEMLQALQTRAKTLATLALYYPDLDPQAPRWSGPTLSYSA